MSGEEEKQEEKEKQLALPSANVDNIADKIRLMVKDQEQRCAALRVLEKNRGKGRSSSKGVYQPHLRAELKLLSDLYKLQWMVEKIGLPGQEGEAVGKVLTKELREEFTTAESVIRKLIEEGKMIPGKPKTSTQPPVSGTEAVQPILLKTPETTSPRKSPRRRPDPVE